ncbi:hypothetical protein ACH5RR_032094 [Cinchona calisaya]|uniref:Uncharacterized protein n=1 Tax=Cinchona calisaya TaxID=153742 RepID=A0ABD2YH45_9GENT
MKNFAKPHGIRFADAIMNRSISKDLAVDWQSRSIDRKRRMAMPRFRGYGLVAWQSTGWDYLSFQFRVSSWIVIAAHRREMYLVGTVVVPWT